MMNEMKSKHSTAFDILTTFMSKFFYLGASFIISILLARLLGAEGKGIITGIFVIPNMMISLADLGVRQASAYYIGQKKYTIQGVLSSSLFLWLITSIISMSVVLVYYLVPSTTDYSIPLIIIALMYVPAKILVSYFNGILQGQQKFGNINMKYVIEFIFRFAFVILLVWVFDLGVVGAVFATFITNVAVLLYSASIIRQTAKLELRYIKGVPQDIFKKGIVFAIGVFVLQLNYKIDIVFLENMVNAHDLGIYSVGVTLAELIWQVPTAIGVVLFARSANSKTDREANERSALLLRISWVPIIIGSILFWVGAPFIVPLLYGEDFFQSAEVIRILLPGIVMMVLFKILNVNLAGRGQPLFAMKIYLVTLAINIVMNLILIPIYGISGAAFSSTVSYIVGALIFSIAYHRYSGIPYKDLFIMNKKDQELVKRTFAKWRKRLGKYIHALH